MRTVINNATRTLLTVEDTTPEETLVLRARNQIPPFAQELPMMPLTPATEETQADAIKSKWSERKAKIEKNNDEIERLDQEVQANTAQEHALNERITARLAETENLIKEREDLIITEPNIASPLTWVWNAALQLYQLLPNHTLPIMGGAALLSFTMWYSNRQANGSTIINMPNQVQIPKDPTPDILGKIPTEEL